MLILSRKVGERILVGDEIVVTVTKVAGNRVAIGIDAPRNVKICRSELAADGSRNRTSDSSLPGRPNGSVSESVNVAAAPA